MGGEGGEPTEPDSLVVDEDFARRSDRSDIGQSDSLTTSDERYAHLSDDALSAALGLALQIRNLQEDHLVRRPDMNLAEEQVDVALASISEMVSPERVETIRDGLMTYVGVFVHPQEITARIDRVCKEDGHAVCEALKNALGLGRPEDPTTDDELSDMPEDA